MAVEKSLLHDRIEKAFRVTGEGVFGLARVIGRNDHTNQGRVRIYPLSETKDWKYIEQDEHIEYYPWAEPLSMSKGENHGIYSTPEYGDFVIYTTLASGHYILGSIVNPSWKYSAVSIPVEAQNIQKNAMEHHTSHWPDLNAKKFHSKTELSDKFHPASFLHRWRKNDILIYNTTKIGDNGHSAAKLMEFRSAENNILQLVDIGNFNIKPGTEAKNSKGYSPVRQTDYRDLWEGHNLNRDFWTERTDHPPKTNESNYIRLATNSSVGSDRDAGGDGKDAGWGDTGGDLPDKSRGTVRWDNRITHGSHETTKTYCPVYQTVKSSKGSDRYFQDKPPSTPWAASLPFRFKIKKWIEDTGNPYDPEAQHFNIGHFLTLSNTIFKRRAMLGSAKGHQLVFSDIDNDEKVILNSHRGKFLYMEDSVPDNYDVMWFASQKHHMIYCDMQLSPYLIDDKGAERHRLLDPNQLDLSSYQLIQTELYQKIWLSDSPKCPRIHAHTTDGHELLLLDHDQGEAGISPMPHKGRVQLTTSDKNQQIVLDVEAGDLSIINTNTSGMGGHGKGKAGDVSIYAAGNLILHAKNMIEMRADLGYDIQSLNGAYSVISSSFSVVMTNGAPHIPEPIRPSVLTDIDVTEGGLTNIWTPS